jgi:hypothetical protein
MFTKDRTTMHGKTRIVSVCKIAIPVFRVILTAQKFFGGGGENDFAFLIIPDSPVGSAA